MKIVGRKSEINELDRLFRSGAPEFVAVYGRRRVGKTFLVKEFFGNNDTGLHSFSFLETTKPCIVDKTP